MAQREQIFTDLGKLTQDLKTWLEQNPQVDMIDQLYIENHIELIRFTYSAWKSKQREHKHGRRSL